MSRRRDKNDDADNDAAVEALFHLFCKFPWYVGLILIVVIYATLAWAIPWMFPPIKDGDTMANRKSIEFFLFPMVVMAKAGAPYIAGVFLFIWGMAQLMNLAMWLAQGSSTKRDARSSGQRVVTYVDPQLLDANNSPIDLEKLTWMEFERLLCEVFAREGYKVIHSGRAGADGGVDIRLSEAGIITLVQCKHWKKWQVDVKVVREMLGLVTHEQASRGIVVTSGTFSREAIEFARSNPIELIDGEELRRRISNARIREFNSRTT